MLTTVLFDLDGSLLPMDFDWFMHSYLKLLGASVASKGYDAELFVNAVLSGTSAMAHGDGSRTNAETFWNHFQAKVDVPLDELEAFLTHFYTGPFTKMAQGAKADPAADRCVKLLGSKGYTVVLATTPMFPFVAVEERCRWAGIDPADFALVTTYTDFRHVKPHIGYYQEILGKIGEDAEHCLMVGNNIREDMCASKLGMQTFLLTPYLLNPDDEDVDDYEHGTLEDLYDKLAELPPRT